MNILVKAQRNSLLISKHCMFVKGLSIIHTIFDNFTFYNDIKPITFYSNKFMCIVRSR